MPTARPSLEQHSRAVPTTYVLNGKLAELPPTGGRRTYELGLVGCVVAAALGLVIIGYRLESEASLVALDAPVGQVSIEDEPRGGETALPVAVVPTTTVPVPTSGAVPAPSTPMAPPILGEEFERAASLLPQPAPTTEVPVTEPPVTEPPSTQPRATEAPPDTIDSPAIDSAADDSAADDSAADDSAANDSAAAESGVESPAPAVIGDVPVLDAPRALPPVLLGETPVTGPVIGTVAIEGVVADAASAAELRSLVEDVFGAERVADNSVVAPGSTAGSLATIRIRDTALFETKRSKIDSSVLPMLERIVVLMRLAPDATITIAGHTDDLGVPEENIELSRLRAESVANYLAFRSISADRLQVVGAGSNYPIASNDEEAGRSQNRRLELVIEGVRPS